MLSPAARSLQQPPPQLQQPPRPQLSMDPAPMAYDASAAYPLETPQGLAGGDDVPLDAKLTASFPFGQPLEQRFDDDVGERHSAPGFEQQAAQTADSLFAGEEGGEEDATGGAGAGVGADAAAAGGAVEGYGDQGHWAAQQYYPTGAEAGGEQPIQAEQQQEQQAPAPEEVAATGAEGTGYDPNDPNNYYWDAATNQYMLYAYPSTAATTGAEGGEQPAQQPEQQQQGYGDYYAEGAGYGEAEGQQQQEQQAPAPTSYQYQQQPAVPTVPAPQQQQYEKQQYYQQEQYQQQLVQQQPEQQAGLPRDASTGALLLPKRDARVPRPRGVPVAFGCMGICAFSAPVKTARLISLAAQQQPQPAAGTTSEWKKGPLRLRRLPEEGGPSGLVPFLRAAAVAGAAGKDSSTMPTVFAEWTLLQVQALAAARAAAPLSPAERGNEEAVAGRLLWRVLEIACKNRGQLRTQAGATDPNTPESQIIRALLADDDGGAALMLPESARAGPRHLDAAERQREVAMVRCHRTLNFACICVFCAVAIRWLTRSPPIPNRWRRRCWRGTWRAP